MLARTGCAVTLVDVEPHSFALARRYFALPDSVECKVADGKSFFYSDTDRYDAIVLDAFEGDHIPMHLRSLPFYYLVADRLAARGVVLANVHVKNDSDRHPDRIAACLSKAFLDVRLLDSEGFECRNAIVMAGAVSRLEPPTMITPPVPDHTEIEAELGTLRFRPLRALWQ